MNPFDSSDTDAVGWHLIARGGDMTARVHAHMQLGVLPSGDFSFEAPDAVVELDTRDEQLCITVVAEGFELEIGDGQRTRDLKVSPQTHIRLEFLGHLLDIDNDFAVASAPGDALEVHVVREGESRVWPESLPAAHRTSAEIIVAEQSASGRSRAGISDSLRREHAAARADKQVVSERGTGVRRIAGALAGSVLVISTLAAVALYVAERSSLTAATSSTEADAQADAQADTQTDTQTDTQADTQADTQTDTQALPGTQPVGNPVSGTVPGASPDLLARFSALLEADPLPDKTTLDFAVESLKSLRVAYPDDPGVPAALAQLTERLVVEARTAYDAGDAFRAGRLIEQAATIGLASASVDETLAYFDSRPPGSTIEPPMQESRSQALAAEAAAVAEDASGAAVPVEVRSAEVLSAETKLAEAMLAEAIALELAATEAERLPSEPSAPAADGLDQLVESATGIALGALAVDMVITDTSPAGLIPAGVPGPMAAVEPEAAGTGGGVEDRGQVALEHYPTEATSEPPVDVNQLPAGFAQEDVVARPDNGRSLDPADELAGLDDAPASSGPIFRPFSELTPTEQVPLTYPRRALEGTEGSVVVEFIVTETGEVTALTIEGDAPAVFIQEAVRAISQWQFQPVQVNGAAVPVQTGLRVTFRG